MIEVREHVPLAPLTTFKIGGSARYFTEVRDEAGLREALSWADEHATRTILLAGGSNVLVPDGGLEALVIRFVPGVTVFAGTRLTAGAGCVLLELIRDAAAHGLGGWEKLAGIPGTLGGAVRGNAGAFGAEIKDVVTRVSALQRETGELREFDPDACDFSYRRSFFKDHPEWIVTSISLALQEVPFDTSARLIEETIAEREKRHLQDVKAAGSFFMNPVAPAAVVALFESEKGVKSKEGRVPAGWLIEKAGLKGYRVGDAAASEQHPNYLVNLGSATAHDVKNVAQAIKLEVEMQFGVSLTEEAALLS